MLPTQLDGEVNDLRKRFRVELVEEEAVINVILFDFPTSTLYNRDRTQILIRVPRAYPDAGLDMFWTDPELKLTDGGIPQNADPIEPYPATEAASGLPGGRWRRFSWHPQPGGPNRWNPVVDNLVSYTQFISRRLSQR